jgi:hypothetical protein
MGTIRLVLLCVTFALSTPVIAESPQDQALSREASVQPGKNSEGLICRVQGKTCTRFVGRKKTGSKCQCTTRGTLGTVVRAKKRK